MAYEAATSTRDRLAPRQYWLNIERSSTPVRRFATDHGVKTSRTVYSTAINHSARGVWAGISGG